MTPESPLPKKAKSGHDPGTRKRFIIYMVISFCTLQALTALLHEVLHLEESVSFWVALVIVSLQNFFVLMYYVYRTSHEHQLHQFSKYLQSIIGFRLWEALLFYVLQEVVGLQYLLVAAIAQGQSVFLKSIVYKRLVFRTKPQPTDEELALADVPPDPENE